MSLFPHCQAQHANLADDGFSQTTALVRRRRRFATISLSSHRAAMSFADLVHAPMPVLCVAMSSGASFASRPQPTSSAVGAGGEELTTQSLARASQRLLLGAHCATCGQAWALASQVHNGICSCGALVTLNDDDVEVGQAGPPCPQPPSSVGACGGKSLQASPQMMPPPVHADGPKRPQPMPSAVPGAGNWRGGAMGAIGTIAEDIGEGGGKASQAPPP